MKTIKLIAIGYLVCLLAACSNEVDFGEQYKKIVYIVNANDKVVKTEHKLVEESEGFITFYCSGTKPLEQDLVINYGIDTNALNLFNKSEYGEDSKSKYLVSVPKENVTFRETSVTIKAGEEFAVLHFSINTENLSLMQNNAIPISIMGVSQGEISPKLKTLFYQLQLKTQYAGNYEAQIRDYDKWNYRPGGSKTISKTVTPLSKNSVRIPFDKKEVSEGDINYYDVTINEDNSLTMKTSVPKLTFLTTPTMKIKDDSGADVEVKINYYNPDTKEFVIAYGKPSDGWTNQLEVLTFVK